MTHTPARRNSGSEKSLTLSDIAKLVGGRLIGDPEIIITGIAGIEEAKEGDIAFFDDERYLPFLHTTQASAVVVPEDLEDRGRPYILVANPSQAFARIIPLFKPSQFTGLGLIHPQALVDPSAEVGEHATVGPYAVIEEGATVGERSIIQASVYVGRNAVIGKDVILYPHVTIREDTRIGDRVIIHSGTVIGSDGFGYETVRGEHVKLPQIGSVWIEDDVEIGANVCVDRGRFSKTWIKQGTKIDNLVQIAHNVVIGPNCLIVSQAGISGSTKLGRNVVVAGQVGIVGHLEIGDEAIIGAGAGVTKSVPLKSVMLGAPAKPIAEQKRLFALIARLPELFKDVLHIKKKLMKEKESTCEKL